jgi:hypothetical protein
MTTAETDLWNKIQGFQLDDPTVKFTFSERVACENGWSKRYALRVIKEYRRFIFLCCTTQTGVTPSDPVDQVWHLHLTYTQSYWIDFCRHTLGREIHHNPTKGGQQEAQKFDGFYTESRQLYIDKFGHEPPADIWQPNDVRFSDIDFQRVNRKRYWLLEKPDMTQQRQLALLGVAVLSLVFVQATGIKWVFILFGGFLFFVLLKALQNNQNRDGSAGNGGCSTAGCGSTDSGHHSDAGHHGDSGDSSGGDSGCSGSGCSGCGGGGD